MVFWVVKITHKKVFTIMLPKTKHLSAKFEKRNLKLRK
jgi:hypothetical protein